MNKRRSRNEWQRLLEEQVSSGLTQKAFCERAGIPVATFGYWRRKLRDEGVARSGERVSQQGVTLDDWIELSSAASDLSPSWHIELDLGNGICLRLRQG